MPTYAIRFDYPEGDTLYAGLHKGALGWAPTIKSAQLYSSEDEAERFLKNGYGASARYGRVVVVKDAVA